MNSRAARARRRALGRLLEVCSVTGAEQDPGGPIFTMTVQDFPDVIERIKANGGIVGQGETSEMLAPDARSSWVRDPNGLLMRVSMPPPAGGRRGAAPPQ